MTKTIQDLRFRPLRYPEFFEYWKVAKQNPWTVFELDFLGDIQSWKNDLIEGERRAITRSFGGFTQAEQLVGEYWTEKVATGFQVPEIIMMAREFGSQESNHLYAYNFSEEVLGLDTFDEFVASKEATDKIQLLLDDESDPITSLAIFSGAVEGCSLFAIFALLASFCRNNKMQTIKEILGWSAVDEELHSQAGIKLFHTFKTDNNHDVNKIIEGFDAVITNEVAFIDYVMKDGDLPTMKRNDLVSYLMYRANDKLKQLGIGPRYTVINEDKAREINREMILLTKGKQHGDFFAGKLSDSYTAVVTQNFAKLNFPKKRNLFQDYSNQQLMM